MQLLWLILAFLAFENISNMQLVKRYKSPNSKHASRHGFIGSAYLFSMDYMFIGNAKIDVDFFGEMAILLYTNKTFAAACPSQFLMYNCTYFIHCTWSVTKPFELAMPFFNLSGYIIETEFFLGGQSGYPNEWGGGFLDVYYAQNCSGGFNIEQLYGALGLGIDGGAYRNFLQDMAFSVILSSDGEEGYLIFGAEFYLDNTVFLTNITKGITNNWHIPMRAISFGGNNISISGEAAFDLSSSVNYMPYNYMEILVQFLNDQGVICSNNTYILPTCTISGSANIGPIIFYTTYGESFSIPFSVYILNENQPIYYLNFIGTTTDSTMNNAQLVTSDYADMIFIGNKYMLGKLIQFNFENLESLYIAVYEGSIPSSIEYNDIVFGIVMVFFLMLIIITLIKIKRKTSNKTPSTGEKEYQPLPTFVETITPSEMMTPGED